ncbi:hypothetical protein M422DRAFT_33157 [Sphaerobolus stellatus SS14]|uniref:Uncharacterized protein n=1 Tax=Sphaerobolus stellatus (strain SS14) TaxID=990650 RepID=A0A0C9VM53_SPHS4|nr:hypothetical protein M422DRAFT_33157 [Sphaerobolus stellatus SS14]
MHLRHGYIWVKLAVRESIRISENAMSKYTQDGRSRGREGEEEAKRKCGEANAFR